MSEHAPTKLNSKKRELVYDNEIEEEEAKSQTITNLAFKCPQENSSANTKLGNLIQQNKELFAHYSTSKFNVANFWADVKKTQDILSQRHIDLELIFLVLCYNLRIWGDVILKRNHFAEKFVVSSDIFEPIRSWPGLDEISNGANRFLTVLFDFVECVGLILGSDRSSLYSDQTVKDLYGSISNSLKKAHSAIIEGKSEELTEKEGELKSLEALLEQRRKEYLFAKNELFYLHRKVSRLSLFGDELKSRLEKSISSRYLDASKADKKKNSSILEIHHWRQISDEIEREIELLHNEKNMIMGRFKELRGLVFYSKDTEMSLRNYLEFDLRLLRNRRRMLERSIQNRLKSYKFIVDSREKNVKDIESFYKKKIKDLKLYLERSEEKLKRIRSDNEATCSKYEAMENPIRISQWMEVHLTHEYNRRYLNAFVKIFELMEDPEYAKLVGRLAILERQVGLLKMGLSVVQEEYSVLDCSSIPEDATTSERVAVLSAKLAKLQEICLEKENSEANLMGLIRQTYATESITQMRNIVKQHSIAHRQALELLEKQNEVHSLKRAASQSRRLNQILATETQMNERKNGKLNELYEIEQKFAKKLEKYVEKFNEKVGEMNFAFEKLTEFDEKSVFIEETLLQQLDGFEAKLKGLKEKLTGIYTQVNTERDALRLSKVNFRRKTDDKRAQESENDLLEDYRRRFNCSLCSRANPVDCMITSCRHVFCSFCIEEKCIKTRNRKCPLCGTKFDKANVIRLEFP